MLINGFHGLLNGFCFCINFEALFHVAHEKITRYALAEQRVVNGFQPKERTQLEIMRAPIDLLFRERALNLGEEGFLIIR